MGIAFLGEEDLLRKGVVRWKGGGGLPRIIFSLVCGCVAFDVSDTDEMEPQLTRAEC